MIGKYRVSVLLETPEETDLVEAAFKIQNMLAVAEREGIEVTSFDMFEVGKDEFLTPLFTPQAADIP